MMLGFVTQGLFTPTFTLCNIHKFLTKWQLESNLPSKRL